MVAVAAITLLLTIALGGLYVGSAVIARHRVQAAADLAALAAASRLAGGADMACAQASAIARAMHATVADCAVDDLDVLITVEVPVAFGAWAMGRAHAIARAGPADGAG